MGPAAQAGATRASILKLLVVYCLVVTVVIGVTHSYKPLAAIAAAAGVAVLAATLLIIRHSEVGGSGPGTPGAERRTQAFGVGIICGLLWVVEISVNNFLAPPLPGRDWFDDLIWVTISLLILVSAARATRPGLGLRAGAVFGAWSGLGSGLVACAMALSLVVFGMPFLVADPVNQQEWVARGAASMAPSLTEYVAFETFAGAFAHLLVVGVAMSTILGVIGGAVGLVSSRAGRRTSGT